MPQTQVGASHNGWLQLCRSLGDLWRLEYDEKKALAIGNPGAVAYDSTRDEILVPN